MRWIVLLCTPAALAQSSEAMAQQRAAAVLQREAARRQAEFASQYRRSAAAAPAADAGCPPLPQSVVEPMLAAAATRHGLRSDLLRAVARQESGFRPCAVSAKGALGLMQLMPATAGRFSVADPLDPAQSLDAGARYLKELLGRYSGDLPLALGAYNAGPGNVPESGGLPEFAETRNYVDAILREVGIADLTPRPPPVLPAIRPDRPAER